MTIISPLPYTLANGTTDDATQVMADFNQIVNNTNANAAHNGANSDITSLSGLTTPLSAAQGGTGNANGTANIAGGTAGAIPYQSAANTTALLAAGTAGQILTSGGAGAPVWTANASYYRNYAHNGCGQVAQRNSTTAAFVTNPIYGQCDRWLMQLVVSGGSTTGTFDQGTMTTLGGYAKTCVQATALTSTSSSSLVMKQRLESRDVVDLNNQTITVQCEVLQATGAAIGYTIAVNAASATDNFSTVTNIATSASQSVPSGAVTQISFTTTLNASQAANGLEFVISAACGTITSQTFKMTNFKVAIAGSVTPYNNSARTFQEELSLCGRYLITLLDGRVSGMGSPSLGFAVSSTVVRAIFPLYGRPSLLPYVTLITGGTIYLYDLASGTSVTGTGFIALTSAYAANGNSIAVDFSLGTGMTVGETIIIQPASGAFLLVSAEL